MKRNKHILVNLTEDQYKSLKYIAQCENRKISDLCYIYLINTINIEILKYITISSSFKKLSYSDDD